MSVKYDLSATDIMMLLGYVEKTGTEWIAKLEQDKNITLPQAYCSFMELAVDCPLLATSDLWVDKGKPTTLYEMIKEIIDDRAAQWAENPEERKGEIYELSQLPVERWPEKVSNYLLIGNDYAGGMWLGIRIQDLQENDPPVYWYSGGKSLTEWKMEEQKLSSFLLKVLFNVLCCSDYDTAENVLEDKGWRYEEYFDVEADDWVASKAVLKQQGVSFQKLKKYKCGEGKSFCCYDEDKNIFYTGTVEDGEISLYAINRKEAERVFVDFDSLED